MAFSATTCRERVKIWEALTEDQDGVAHKPITLPRGRLHMGTKTRKEQHRQDL
jgi:hypothetical protein